ncbi:MAG: fumarylacetoacetate hydrolase family protein [Pseudomonadota bacterium]|nr:fumarylacetoacetate hydrolase family protein [Pseudomonadota bacterium]
MSDTTEMAAQAADRLARAERDRAPCPPIRDLIDRNDTASAYAVQSRLEADAIAAGRVLTGRKIGLTSLAVQAQLGVDQPDFGSLFADTGFEDGSDIDTGRFLQPRIEAEVALALSRDIDAASSSAEDILAAVDWVAPALEIVDSRIANWDISLADTIADNASYGGHVIGPKVHGVSGIDFPALKMELTQDGDVVSTGSGRDCMGSPLIAAAWLATTLAGLGQPIRAGQIILTGALGPMVAVKAPGSYVATIEGLGRVACRFR